MTVKMDKFGRILIPKDVRERNGLEPGDAFRLHDQTDAAPGAIHLEKVPRVRFVRVPSDLPWPVYDFVDESGNPVEVDIDWANAVEQAREERIDQIISSLG